MVLHVLNVGNSAIPFKQSLAAQLHWFHHHLAYLIVPPILDQVIRNISFTMQACS
jgi:hypothetical protein